MSTAAPTIIEKTSLPYGIHHGMHLHKEPKGIKKVMHHAADEAQDVGTITSITKAARGAIQLFDKAGPSFSSASHVIAAFSYFADVVKTLGIVKYVKELVELAHEKPTKPDAERLRNLKIASSVYGVAVGSMTGLKILDVFGAFKLANITKSLGRIPVIGQAAPFLPFASVLSMVEITKSSLDIAISAYKIEALNRKIDGVKQKLHTWKNWNLVSNGTIDAPSIQGFADQKIHRLQAKIDAMTPDLIEDEFAASEGELANALITQFQSASPSKQEIFRAYANYEIWHTAKEKIERLRNKQISWRGVIVKATEGLNEDELHAIQAFKNAKIQKWEFKKVLLGWDKVKEGASIFLNSIAIVAMVASIVLTALGIVILPVLITMTSIFLFITLLGFGLQLFKKYQPSASNDKAPRPAIGVDPRFFLTRA